MTVSTPKNFRLTRAFDWLKQGDGCELSGYCKELTEQRGHRTKETDISCQSTVKNLQSNVDRKKIGWYKETRVRCQGTVQIPHCNCAFDTGSCKGVGAGFYPATAAARV